MSEGFRVYLLRHRSSIGQCNLVMWVLTTIVELFTKAAAASYLIKKKKSLPILQGKIIHITNTYAVDVVPRIIFSWKIGSTNDLCRCVNCLFGEKRSSNWNKYRFNLYHRCVEALPNFYKRNEGDRRGAVFGTKLGFSNSNYHFSLVTFAKQRVSLFKLSDRSKAIDADGGWWCGVVCFVVLLLHGICELKGGIFPLLFYYNV